jgi:hypothetical protein
MKGLRRPKAGRTLRVGVLALLSLVCFASAAMAATSHNAKKSAATSTAGLSAHVSGLNAAGGQLSPVPGPASGPIDAAGTNTSLGAGAEVGGVALATAGTTFTMPAFSCASNSDSEWLLPGLWVFDSSGNLVDQVDVNFNCNGGSKLQESVICIEGGSCDTSVHPNPGDVIEAVYVQTSSIAIGEIIDRTQGTVASASGSPTTGSTILEGDMGPAAFGVTQVPTFIKVPFSISTLNGFYIGDWGPARLNLKTGAFVQIAGGAIKTTSFGTTWKHN